MAITAQGIRYPAGGNSPDIPRDIQNLAVDVDLRIPPIGSVISWDGIGDPPGGVWILADGRLIDRTTYASYYSVLGHAFNGGVDPGANKVRIQDRRGRMSIGQDNMGTAQGAANRLAISNRLRGQNGGFEQHSHTNSIGVVGIPQGGGAVVNAIWALDGASTNGATPSSSLTSSMPPYEVGNKIVRIA